MDTLDRSEQTSLADLLRPVWSRRWLVVAIVVFTTAGAYLYFAGKPKEYTANTALYLQATDFEQVLGLGDTSIDPQRNAQNIATLITSRAVAVEVAGRLPDGRSPEELLGSVEASASQQSDFISITATDSSPEGAAKLANAFAQSLVAVRGDAERERISTALEAAESQLQGLPQSNQTLAERQRLAEQVRSLRALQEVPPVNVEQLDPASPPGAPSAPHPERNAAFAFLISLVVAWLLAYALEWRDRRIKRLDDMEGLYELPLIGAVPQASDDKTGADLTEVDSLREAHRTLRTNLELSLLDHPLRTIIVVSAIPGEGKSTVVRNLALAYKEAGSRVAIVESDLRNPVLAHRFMLQAQPGLTNVLAGAETLENALQATVGTKAVTSVMGNGGPANGNSLSTDGQLSVLTSGPTPPNPPAVLSSKRVHTLLEEIADQYDVVLIDSPPLLAVSDALPLLRIVDGIVVVGRVNWVTRDAAQRVAEIVRRPGNVPVLGVVANGVPDRDFTAMGVQPYGYGNDEQPGGLRGLFRRLRRP